jgi:photoactive yellow protein
MKSMTTDEQLLSMSDAELDALPQGIIRVDRHGTIFHYNTAEAQFARREAACTIGLNFFYDVAPCTDVREFHGRFIDFVNSDGARVEPFSFEFRFGWENRRVSITMVRRPTDTHDENIYILVNMTQVE